MKRVAEVLLVFFLVGSGVAIFVLENPPAMPQRSLVFALVAKPEVTNHQAAVAVTISNASAYPLNLPVGFRDPTYKVEYKTNGTWATNWVISAGRAETVLAPGGVIQSTVHFAADGQAVRVGLPITSLTWRGRFAWWLLGHGNLFVLGRVEGYLARKDLNLRTRTEYSEVLSFEH